MDNVFENFVSSVYTGGSSIEFFDNHFEVVGGVDDISVSSIFGGCSCSEMEGFQEEYEASQKAQDDADAKPTATGAAPQPDNDGAEEEEALSLVTTYEANDSNEDDDITTEYKPAGKKKETPKVGSGSLSGGLSANEVSELLSVYN